VARDGVATLRIDTQDPAAVLAACRGLPHLAGITTSSEYFVSAAATVASQVGLPGPDGRSVEECRDKGLQRRCLQAAGLLGPRFRVVDSVEEGMAAAAEIGLDLGQPVVVKPVSGTGSIAVRLC
jgi:biotin carboxylase